MTRVYSRILFKRCQALLKSKSLLMLGPRQVGKSTLLAQLKPDLTINFASERVFLEHLKDPGLIERQVNALKRPSLVLIDEVQRIPTILNTIQSLVDDDKSLKFALSGSSARKLARGQANLLPGRILFERLFPLTFWEITRAWNKDFLARCLIKGTLPEVVDSEIADDILESYVDIYLREEIQAEALTKDLGDYSRFLTIAAECSGQFINYAKIASESEINKEKVRRYFEILEDTLLIHRIESFDKPISGRKARQKDRFIFFDNGVRNAILRKNRNNFTNTELGSLFESWVFQQLIAWNQYHKKNWKLLTYRDDGGLEVDLIIETKNRTYLIEIKYQSKYRTEFAVPLKQLSTLLKNKSTKSIVLYLGEHEQLGSDGESILPLSHFFEFIKTLD